MPRSNTLDLDKLVLLRGAHDNRSKGVCLLEEDAETHRFLAESIRPTDTVERVPVEELSAARPLYRREEHRRGRCPVRDGQASLPLLDKEGK